MVSDVVIKILQYSGDKQRNLTKLKKYLLLLRKENHDKKRPGTLELSLGKHGVTKSLIMLMNQIASNESQYLASNPKNPAPASQQLHEMVQLISIVLSVLGNAFAVDAGAVREAETLNFLASLQVYVGLGNFDEWNDEKNLTSRCFRCVANLATNSGVLREDIVKAGFGSMILNAMDHVFKKLESVASVSNDVKLEDVIVENNEESVITEGARAIRILCCVNNSTQQDYLQHDAVLRLGRFLLFSYNQNMFSELFKALVLLTSNMKRLPSSTVDAITNIDDSEKNLLRRILNLVQNYRSVNKILDPAIICLVQLTRNPNLTNAMIDFGVFDATLSLIKSCDDTHTLEKLATILVQLTSVAASSSMLSRYESEYSSPRVRLACCPQVGETIKLLRSNELKKFHMWVLHLYENLYEGKLKDLVSRGILSVLLERLEEEVGNLEMERLNALMQAVENNKCHVHTSSDKECPFLPQYSCSSPSYREVETKSREQSGMQAANVISAMLNSTYVSSSNLSPPGSPGVCKDYSDEITTSPTCSPIRERSPGLSEDDTASPMTVNGDASSEDDEMNSNYDSEENEESLILNGKRSLSFCNEGESYNEAKRFKMSELTRDDRLEESTAFFGCNENSSCDTIRQKSKKIVSILGILLRCSHFSPLPKGVSSFLPFLLEMIWRGRLSVERGETCQVSPKTPEDMLPLSRLCFQRSYKILLRICFDIHTFSKLVEEGIIPIIYRILVYNLHPCNLPKDRELQVKDFMRNYSNKIMQTLIGLSGDTNETVGWRQGYLHKKCIESVTSSSSCLGLLAVPLLYLNNVPLYFEFERSTQRWMQILCLLKDSDNLPAQVFQYCILALNCIAQTKGLKWNEPGIASQLNLMYETQIDVQLLEGVQDSVEFYFDDGSSVVLPKKYFVEASPVFQAMLDGSFREAHEQRVHLKQINPITLKTLFTELVMESSEIVLPNYKTNSVLSTRAETGQTTLCRHDISTLLELLLLSDQYFLVDLHKRVMHTLITNYFCPHSVTTIFQQSLKVGGLQKTETEIAVISDTKGKGSLNLNLTYLALKYLLVGENICYSLRTAMFRKIFEYASADLIVNNLAHVLQLE